MKKFDLFASLTHADEKLIDHAAKSMSGKPKIAQNALWGRIGVVAASLAVIVTVSAVALPILMSGDPAETQAGHNVLQGTLEPSDTLTDSLGDVADTPAPPAILQVIPLSVVESVDGETSAEGTPSGGMVGTFTQESFWRDSYAVLTFDASLGTDVTLTSFWDNLYAHDLTVSLGGTLENAEEDGRPTDKILRKVLASFRRPMTGRGAQTASVNINEQYVVWGYDTKSSSGNSRLFHNLLDRMENAKEEYGENSKNYLIFKERYDSHYASRWGDTFGGLILAGNEDVLIYTIRDDNGEITAVGAIYTYHKHLIDNADHIYYDDVVITRYADLGCVRFDTPVTEEEAKAQIVALCANIPTVKESMDFTPQNSDENYMAGLADLLANYPFDPPTYDHYSTSGFSHSSADNYCTFHVGWVSKDEDVIDAGHANHVFRIYNDGTWEEVTDDLIEEETNEPIEIPQDTQ